MQAITIDRGELQFCANHPTPQPNPDEILVRVTLAGVCETDLQLAAGYMGFSGVLGHEFVGIAESGELFGS